MYRVIITKLAIFLRIFILLSLVILKILIEPVIIILINAYIIQLNIVKRK